MTSAFTTKTRNHGRRAWKCNGKCAKEAKFRDAADGGKWNNATKPTCTECGYKPNTSCCLWGDGLGVNGGKWKKDNGVAPTSPPQPPQPSKQTPAGKAATEKKRLTKTAERQKLKQLHACVFRKKREAEINTCKKRILQRAEAGTTTCM